jgi:hypothetical protein
MSRTWKYAGFPMSKYLLISCQQEPSLCYSLVLIPDVAACPSQRSEKKNFTILMSHTRMNIYTYRKGIKTSHDAE